jgi:hypothetical protein
MTQILDRPTRLEQLQDEQRRADEARAQSAGERRCWKSLVVCDSFSILAGSAGGENSESGNQPSAGTTCAGAAGPFDWSTSMPRPVRTRWPLSSGLSGTMPSGGGAGLGGAPVGMYETLA